jgi:heptosyltransferase-1
LQRILLVKTSSLGDVVHNLPVVGDLRAALGDVRIDWVVESGFSAIPAMHPDVEGVIPVSLRRWRTRPFSTDTRMELRALRTRLRETHYDAVIDTQGLLKSALIVAMSNGVSHGRDWRSSREPLALFYDKVHSIPWSLHAVERNRLLASLALGYPLSGPPVYGVQASVSSAAALGVVFPDATPRAFAVLLHATSAAKKEWPEENWIGLGNVLAARGVCSVLPFGNAKEQQRSERLAARIPDAVVPPALDLDTMATLLANARIVFGVDTGLSHLAVSLGAPTVGLFCATDPVATGLFGLSRLLNLGGVGATPSINEAVAAMEVLLENK